MRRTIECNDCMRGSLRRHTPDDGMRRQLSGRLTVSVRCDTCNRELPCGTWAHAVSVYAPGEVHGWQWERNFIRCDNAQEAQ